jgi:hypothetical protein
MVTVRHWPGGVKQVGGVANGKGEQGVPGIGDVRGKRMAVMVC